MKDLLLTTNGKVAVITLNRPRRLNALTKSMVGQLARAITQLDQDPDVSAIVLTVG